MCVRPADHKRPIDLREEEKATDVNIASHLLFDVLTSRVGAGDCYLE